MANLKNITDLPMAASAEGLNLIVNDNGAAKQIAASAVCKVKSVNGTQPDENGNVQIDTVSSWNDLKDKPFYAEAETYTILENCPVTELDEYGEAYYVNVITDKTFSFGDKVLVTVYDKQYELECYNSQTDNEGNTHYWVEYEEDGSYIFSIGTGVMDEGYGIGVFLHSGPSNVTVTVTHETVHKLDPKYVPSHVAVVTINGEKQLISHTIEELFQLSREGYMLILVNLDQGYAYHSDMSNLFYRSIDTLTFTRFMPYEDGHALMRFSWYTIYRNGTIEYYKIPIAWAE